MQKKSKKVLLIFLTILFCFSLTSCDTSSNDMTPEKYIEICKSNYQTCARYFVECIINEDYKTLHTLLNLPDNSLVTTDSIKYALPRGRFAEVYQIAKESKATEQQVTCSISEKQGVSNTSTTDKNVKIICEVNGDSRTSVTVDIGLNDKNEWYVKPNELYYPEYSLVTCGGFCDVYVNNVKLNPNQIDKTYKSTNGNSVKYILSNVGVTKLPIRIKSANFDYKSSFTPIDNEDLIIEVFPSVSNTDGALEFLKTSLNSILENYTTSKPISSINQYIDSDADIDTSGIIYTALSNIYTQGSKENNSNYRISRCKPTSTPSYWISENRLVLNFDYELTWTEAKTLYNQSMRRTSSIVLSLKEGEYKIASVPDVSLFSKADANEKQW